MNYAETLDYLYSQLPMYQRIGAHAFKKDLTNIIKLCTELDSPQTKFKSIHIAGTNGKGSVAHIMASVLQELGLKVGLYTSPHYKDFRERIKINGKFITEAAVVRFVEQNSHLFKSIEPSFFEITVAMAFDYFASEEVDIAVIETGLGGKLDSTNILSPILSVITNIGYDHQQFLGDTLPEIAGEKAGIIKANTPVVIGETHDETSEVFGQKASEMNASIIFADQLPNIDTSLREGGYQAKNIQTALVALKQLEQFDITDSAITFGLKNLSVNTNFIGRYQVLSEKPKIIADSAHNIDGVTLLISSLERESYDNIHIVLGMVADKDHASIFPLMPKQANYYFCKPDMPRGLDAKELQEKAENYSLAGNYYPSVANALDLAKQNSTTNDLILVMGSVFVVAEVL